jgi:uncharacterized protein YndB with AHSA1/START domain
MIPPDDTATLVLRRTFAAPRDRVFRAWIEPAALERWLRPRGIRVTVGMLEVRVGGRFRFDLEDGSSIQGTYLEISPSEKLVFTWFGRLEQGHETIVTVDFLDLGSVTEIVLTHEGLTTPEQRVRAGAGWPSLLDALAEALTSSHLDG